MTMRRATLAKMIYKQTDLSVKESKEVVDSAVDVIRSELEKGSTVKITGFGKWSINKKRARKGRNPQTGKEIKINARKVITFKSSPVLRKVVNSGG